MAPDAKRVRELTKTGEFNIKLLQLNRLDLCRLRRIRQRLCKTVDVVAHGLRVLHDARSRLDRLPRGVRPYVMKLREGALSGSEQAHARIEDMLRQACRSPLLDEDPGRRQGAKARREYLHELGALAPGCLRLPKSRPKNRRRRRRG
ncbi:MAG: hypothetical protein HY721_03025 [Planctomycetes bacterium]|nr:hypothetical protein [Planctomycetota bacterium]